MINIDKWTSQLPELRSRYKDAGPYPHIVLDDFLDEQIADDLLKAFPVSFSDKGWIHWRHYNEDKHGLNDLHLIPAVIKDFIRYMNSDDFVNFLEQISGIDDLVSDPGLEGGGIHLSERGGHLNIHADFSTHPRRKDLHRRLNALLYLNRDWQESYKGALELWTADMKRCEKKVYPMFNRLVIFSTTATSYHGFPDALECPAGETRKSIAFYYYNKTEAENRIVSTSYQIRPGEGLKAVPNWIDNKLLLGYTYLKRNLGINDDLASKILGFKEWFRKSNKDK